MGNYIKLPEIVSGCIPKVLLLGNGINNATTKSDNDFSWNELLGELSTKKYDKHMDRIEKIPFPLQAVALTEDHIDFRIDEVSKRLLPNGISKERRELLIKFTDLPYDVILTTNYSYEIEIALRQDFYCKSKCKSKWRKMTATGNKKQEQFGIFKCFELTNNEKKYIWHIHGEAARPSSMVLGHYYYGNLLSLIQAYMSDLLRRMHGSFNNKKPFLSRSWIDWFLIGEVHIVGLGMDFSEMDLWWLIGCKKRNFSEFGKTYYYEPGMKTDGRKFAKRALAESYDVIIPDIEFSGDYPKYYDRVADNIMQNRFS